MQTVNKAGNAVATCEVNTPLETSESCVYITKSKTTLDGKCVIPGKDKCVMNQLDAERTCDLYSQDCSGVVKIGTTSFERVFFLFVFKFVLLLYIFLFFLL